MKNKFSGWCVTLAILGYIFGVAFCFTFILIPLAVYCFIGARKYMIFSAMSDAQLYTFKKSLTGWAIFFSIVGFPLGLISIIPAVFVSSNNITILMFLSLTLKLRQSKNHKRKIKKNQPKKINQMILKHLKNSNIFLMRDL